MVNLRCGHFEEMSHTELDVYIWNLGEVRAGDENWRKYMANATESELVSEC